MPNPDAERHERLLRLAAWLHHRHLGLTRVAGKPYTEARFTREDLDDVPDLRTYGLAAGDAGEKALMRDSRALADFGLDLRWDPTTQEWISRATSLSDAERRALATAALSVVIEDVSTTVPGAHVPGAGVTPQAAEIVVGFAAEIDVAVEAIRTRSRLELTHRGRNRTIDPWSVLFRDGRWYVTGLDTERDAQRTFSFDGIEEMQPIGPPGAFTIPDADFEATALRVGEPDRWTSDGESVEVSLRVDTRFAGRAESLLGAVRTDETDESGHVPMAVRIANVDAFIYRLFGLRSRAVVVGPPAVREVVIDHLRDLV